MLPKMGGQIGRVCPLLRLELNMKKILLSIVLLSLTFAGMGGCNKKEASAPPSQPGNL